MTCSCSVCGAKLNAVFEPGVDIVRVAPCPGCLRVLASIAGAALLDGEDSKRVADATIEAVNSMSFNFDLWMGNIARHVMSK